ncbi:MAG: hypothetical protein KAH23_07060 [Kiritimatiellae bacterium]|nr:hypothetical protein [Kiritimatiellia bacterium]
MVDDVEEKDGLPLPPKLNLRKQEVQVKPVIPASGTGAIRSETIKLKPAKPVTLPKLTAIKTSETAPTVAPSPIRPASIRSTPVTPASKSAAKKETSRIPLDAATAASIPGAIVPTQAPKTIRITPKPVASPSTIKLKPKSAIHSVAAVGNATDKKKETSRIPLDAALAPESKEATGPRTIRLKRPGAGPQLKTAATRPKVGERTGLGATTRMEDTAQMDIEEPATPTRRKTIRVKRPEQKDAPKAVSIAKPENTAPLVDTVVEDQPNWFFPFCAVLAIFVVIATIYVFCSQAAGPNPSLSQLSWYIEGPDLGMPMKIAPPRR